MNELQAFWKRYRILITLISIALIFYAVGYKKGSMIAIGLGVLFEIFFWGKLIRGDRRE